MRKLLLVLVTGMVLGGSGAALAASPEDPGCFGQQRAAIIKQVFIAGEAAPGGSEWGQVAAGRAESNVEQNEAYRHACGGMPG